MSRACKEHARAAALGLTSGLPARIRACPPPSPLGTQARPAHLPAARHLLLLRVPRALCQHALRDLTSGLTARPRPLPGSSPSRSTETTGSGGSFARSGQPVHPADFCWGPTSARCPRGLLPTSPFHTWTTDSFLREPSVPSGAVTALYSVTHRKRIFSFDSLCCLCACGSPHRPGAGVWGEASGVWDGPTPTAHRGHHSRVLPLDPTGLPL